MLELAVTLGQATGSRAEAVVYFLSGALIAVVPLIVFGALVFVLLRIYWRSERDRSTSAAKKR